MLYRCVEMWVNCISLHKLMKKLVMCLLLNKLQIIKALFAKTPKNARCLGYVGWTPIKLLNRGHLGHVGRVPKEDLWLQKQKVDGVVDEA